MTKGTLVSTDFDGKEALFKAVIKESIVPSLLLAEDAAGLYDGSISELLSELVMAWWEKLTGSSICGTHQVDRGGGGQFPGALAVLHGDEVVARAREQQARRALSGAARRSAARCVTVNVNLAVVETRCRWCCSWLSG